MRAEAVTLIEGMAELSSLFQPFHDDPCVSVKSLGIR